jgi:hypothetical protein
MAQNSSDTNNHMIIKKLDNVDLRIKYNYIGSFHTNYDTRKCDIIFNFQSNNIDYNARTLCPGKCHPIPIINLPINSFKNTEISLESTILCSLTLNMINKLINEIYLNNKLLNNNQEIINTNILEISDLINNVPDIFLYILFIRFISECNESYQWNELLYQLPDIYAPLKLLKRNVFGLVIWIGSNDRKYLLENQHSILNYDMFKITQTGNDAVIAIGVTELHYPCLQHEIICRDNTSTQGDFRNYLPRTFLHNNSRGFGWSCAQRRPLRTLAHVLLLYNPTFIILVDDDTYVNYPLIMTYYKDWIDTKMRKVPIVVGHYILKRTMTAKGLFYGGTGYLIGKKVIDRLTSNEVRFMRTPRRDRYTSELAMFREIRHTNHSCNKSCLLAFKERNGILPIAIRLIDICVNMLAGPNTCYHR